MNDRNFVDNKIQKISTTGFNPTSNNNLGYSRSNLQKQSVQNNYLRDGFYAMNKDQEIQTKLTVQFLDKIIDVTE